MAYDKKVDSSALNANLTAVANAIREKAGSTGSLSFPDGFISAIADIAPGSDLEVIADETITVTSDISTTARTIYSSSALKNLERYVIYIHFTGTISGLSLTEFLARSDAEKQVIIGHVTATSFTVYYNNCVSIDTSGSVKVKSTDSNNKIRKGSYRLLIVAGGV